MKVELSASTDCSTTIGSLLDSLLVKSCIVFSFNWSSLADELFVRSSKEPSMNLELLANRDCSTRVGSSQSAEVEFSEGLLMCTTLHLVPPLEALLSVFVRLLTQSPSLVCRLSTFSSTLSASFTTSPRLLPNTSSTVPTSLPTSLVRSCRASKIPITSLLPNPLVLELFVGEELLLSSSTTSSFSEISPSSSSLRISSKPSSTWSTMPPTPFVRVLTVSKSPTMVDLTGPPSSEVFPNQKAGKAGRRTRRRRTRLVGAIETSITGVGGK